MIYQINKNQEPRTKNQAGVTLLLAILILSSVLAISFSLATILFIEVRTSGDLLKTEPAYYAATGVGEQALFNLERNACPGNGANCYTSSFGNSAILKGTPVVLSTSTPIINEKIKAYSTFGTTLNKYDFCNVTAGASGCNYGRVTVSYVTTNSGTSPLNVYLCEYNPSLTVIPYGAANYGTLNTSYSTEPCTSEAAPYGSSRSYWNAPNDGVLDSNGSFSLYASNSSATWNLDPTMQQQLILVNNSGTDIYAKIHTYGPSPYFVDKGLPYVGKTAVDINTTNAAVGRKIQVIVPSGSSSLSSGPMAYWRLDDPAGATSFADSSGSDNPGSCPGGLCPTMDVAGHVGTAESFNGTNNYINLARSSLNHASQWTFAAWVYPVGDGYVYTEGIPQVTFIFGVTGGTVITDMWNQNQPGNWVAVSSPAGSINYNTWNHIAVTLENGGVGTGTLKFYINGVLVSTVAGQTEDNASALYAALGDNIGAYGGGQGHSYFKGKIDDVRIYNRALSAGEIAALAQ